MKARHASLKTVVNDALRAGLAPHVERAAERRPPFRTATFDGGRYLLGSLEGVGETLSVLEGDRFK